MLEFVARVLAKKRKLPLEDSGLAGRSVFILGMHRSGTSCLAGMLWECGLELGEARERNNHNKKGNRELKEVQRINNDLLSLGEGSWNRPRRAVFTNAGISARIKKIYGELGASGRLWGVKDPRMLFCLDAWRNPLSVLVGTFRHPNNVAVSLLARGNGVTNISEGLELWHDYNRELVRLYRQSPFTVVDFDWDTERYCRAVRMIAEGLGLEPGSGTFFEDELRHNRECGAIEDPRHRALYDDLREISVVEEKKLTARRD